MRNIVQKEPKSNSLTANRISLEKEGQFALFISALAFSLMSICVKKLATKIPIIEIVFFRGILCLLITSLQLKINKINPWGINKSLLIARGLLGTLALYCVFRALGSLPIASATIIQYTYPTFTTLGAWILLKEKINKKIFLALIIGWLGICFVVNPEWSNNASYKYSSIEVLLALSGAILTSLAYICVRILSKEENGLVIVFYFPLVSTFLTAPLILNNYIVPSYSDFAWIIGIGLFTQIGQVKITKGLTLLPAAKACTINYVQVLFASIWGFFIFSERINLETVIGGTLVLLSSLISINHRKIISKNPI